VLHLIPPFHTVHASCCQDAAVSSSLWFENFETGYLHCKKLSQALLAVSLQVDMPMSDQAYTHSSNDVNNSSQAPMNYMLSQPCFQPPNSPQTYHQPQLQHQQHGQTSPPLHQQRGHMLPPMQSHGLSPYEMQQLQQQQQEQQQEQQQQQQLQMHQQRMHDLEQQLQHQQQQQQLRQQMPGQGQGQGIPRSASVNHMGMQWQQGHHMGRSASTSNLLLPGDYSDGHCCRILYAKLIPP
jgi:hypothetical protein